MGTPARAPGPSFNPALCAGSALAQLPVSTSTSRYLWIRVSCREVHPQSRLQACGGRLFLQLQTTPGLKVLLCALQLGGNNLLMEFLDVGLPGKIYFQYFAKGKNVLR